MSSRARRAMSELLSFMVRAADPSTVSTRGQIFAKSVGGSGEIFYKNPSGITNQLCGVGATVPRSYVRGLQLSWTTVARVTVAAGRARNSTDTWTIDLAAPTVVDIAVAGVNGLDTGAEAANTWYAVYVIGDTTGVNAGATLLSASFTAPTLPAGYDVFRRIGAVRNGAGSDFLRFFQRWNGRTRRYWFDESRATLQVLTNGHSVAGTTTSAAARMPSTCGSGIFGLDFLVPLAGAAVTDFMGTGIAVSSLLSRISSLSTASLLYDIERAVSTSQAEFYNVTDVDDTANLFVIAFDDEL